MKNLIRKYIKDLFTETSNFGFSEILISCVLIDITEKIMILNLDIKNF